MTSWISNIDNKWVNINLIDIEQCVSSSNYIWDAQGFGGIVSFAKFYLMLKDDKSKANKDLNIDFLYDKSLNGKIIYCLENMLNNERLQMDMEDGWEESKFEIIDLLSGLKSCDLSKM